MKYYISIPKTNYIRYIYLPINILVHLDHWAMSFVITSINHILTNSKKKKEQNIVIDFSLTSNISHRSYNIQKLKFITILIACGLGYSTYYIMLYCYATSTLSGEPLERNTRRVLANRVLCCPLSATFNERFVARFRLCTEHGRVWTN